MKKHRSKQEDNKRDEKRLSIMTEEAEEDEGLTIKVTNTTRF